MSETDRILTNRDNKDVELVCTTKFARIFKYKSKYAIKSIETDIVIAPHNPRFELSILKKLSQQGHNMNVIKLLESREITIYEDELELCFEWYPTTLSKFMQSNWQLKSFKRKFNPYYSMSLDKNDNNTNKVEYVNTFDINQYSVNFFKQLINGLSFIHNNDIIHRDIKPENILMKLDPLQLVITDFGISYDMGDIKQTINEPINSKICDISTSFYKAPELLFSVKNYSKAVDIWSLAIIITQWFIVKGRYETIPALFDNGLNETEDGNGSDIRLIMSIFEILGIPSINEWVEVKENGSIDAFIGLFGENGDGKYIYNQNKDEQISKLIEHLPRLNDLTNVKEKTLFINSLLGMLQLDSIKRWDITQINNELERWQI